MPDRSLDEILADAENPAYIRVVTAKVLLRQDLVARHAELGAELAKATTDDALSNDPDQAPAIAHQIDELQQQIESARVTFKFHNVGKKAWADLLRDHPPTKEQLAIEAENAKLTGRKPRPFDHNTDTFPIAAIAAASQSPKMDVDAVTRLEAALTDSQFTVLWNACLDANLGGAEVPKSLAAGRILQMNGQYANSVSAAAELSAAANS